MLNVAILGPGRFAAGRIVPALRRATNISIAAVIGRDRARVATFAEEHGIDRAYEDLGAALADSAIDAVWVATPNAEHRAQVEQIAAARKAVLCEKPLATTVVDAEAMVRACNRYGVALGCGFHLRHHPLHREARRLVASGALGSVLAAQAEWSLPRRPASAQPPPAWRSEPAIAGGGILTATGIHALDLLRFVLDDEIEELCALTDGGPTEPPLESRAVVLARFRRGTLAEVRCASGLHAPTNDLRLQGESASLIANRTLDEVTRGSLDVAGADAELAGLPAGSDMYAAEVAAFATAVQTVEPPNASGEDGLRLARILAAVYDSAASGRSVRLER